MSGRVWTEEQRRAIESKSKNLIVSAGAGSGKTAVMIERIARLMGEGADVKEMLVCTFTKTAATDMRRKLTETLSASSDHRLRRAVNKLASAEICTLHSWCAKLIKNRFFDCGASPEFSVLEEGEQAMLLSASAESAIEAMRETGDGDFAELYEALRNNRKHDRLRNAAVAVYGYARSQKEPGEWLNLSAAKTDGEYRAVLLSELASERELLISRAKRLLDAFVAAGFKLDVAALGELTECAENWEWVTLPTPRMGSDKTHEELHAAFMSLRAEYKKLLGRKTEVDELPSFEGSLKHCRALASLVRKIDEVYGAAKKARGKMDYGDLEHLALRILCGKHGREIADAYKYVFVDEYQDISPLQEAILSKFECNMFFVGDVKQSIYGFRMCRPEFFANKWKSYESGAGEALKLTANFRSGSDIIDCVNSVFEKVMTVDFGKVDYRGQRMRAQAADGKTGEKIKGRAEALFVPLPEETGAAELPELYSVRADAESDKKDTASMISLEADAVVDEIIGMAEDGLSFGDIAVIVRSRGKFTRLLERKLREADIPVCSASGDERADSFASVSALVSFMRLLDNADDDINLTAVMLSPAFGGFSASELADIRKKGDGRFFETVYGEAANGDNVKLKSFVDGLKKFRAYADESTVGELAGKITAEYKCFNHALVAGGSREAAALDAFLEHLGGEERNVLHDWLKYIDSCGVPRIKVPESGGSVRIMTVHASKGLEFDGVIIPEIDKSFNFSDTYDTVICDEKEGIVMRSFDFEKRAVTANARYKVCSRELYRALSEEALRTLYVAMTRAKRRLILVAPEPKKKENDGGGSHIAGSYGEWLYDYMETIKKEPYVPEADEPVKTSAAPDLEVTEEMREHFAAHAAVTERNRLAESRVKASVSGIIRESSEVGENPREKPLYDDDRAAKRGSACHKFMQWADFSKDPAAEWERLCARFPAESELLLGDREKMIEAFGRVGGFIAGRQILREKQFVYLARAGEVEGTNGDLLVQGVIDLMIEDGDGVTILDYKTGKRENIACETYLRQLALYKLAVEKVLRLPVKETYLYGIDCLEFVRIDTKNKKMCFLSEKVL